VTVSREMGEASQECNLDRELHGGAGEPELTFA
jgi:hypothetical protein